MMSRWVFLRGLIRESRHWGNFPALFKQHVPGTEVSLPDLPGNGHLYDKASPSRVEQMVEHYRATMAAQNLPPPYYLFALSLGAIVAVAWAHRYPDEVNGCVLMNASLRPFSPFYRRLRWRIYPTLLRMALMRRDAPGRERLILQLTCSRWHAHDDTLKSWELYQRECPVSRSNLLRQLIAAASYRAPGIRPPAPMLVLASAADRLVDPACSRALAGKWHTDFAMHPTAGHDLPLDDGLWVAMQVRHWMRCHTC